jgi:hypothetical protein
MKFDMDVVHFLTTYILVFYSMVHARTCEMGHFLLGILNIFARINSEFSCYYFILCFLLRLFFFSLFGLIWGQI